MKRLLWRAEAAWLAGVALLLVLGYWWFPGRTVDLMDTFSTTAGGKRAFFTLTERLMVLATRTGDKLWDQVGDPDTMCILGPARYPDSGEWDWLTLWTSYGQTLIFAARLDDPAVDLRQFGVRVVPDVRMIDRGNVEKEPEQHPSDSPADGERPRGEQGDDVRDDRGVSERGLRSLLRAPVVETPLATGKFHWLSAGHIETSNKNAEVLVTTDGKPQVVRLPFGRGTLIVCSSDYIFTNKSLATDDNGLLAFRILEAGDPHAVVFDESLNASGAPKIVGLLFDPQMRLTTLQLLLVTLLFCWAGFRRFGPAVIPVTAAHRSMTEHAIALGNLHRKAGTVGQAVHWYFDYFRNELRLHYAADSAAVEATLLARRTGSDEQATARLLAGVRHGIGPDRISAGRAAGLIRELAAIKNKLDRAKGARNGT